MAVVSYNKVLISDDNVKNNVLRVRPTYMDLFYNNNPIRCSTDQVFLGETSLTTYLNNQFTTIGEALDGLESSFASCVTLSGVQTITGKKTFNSGTI